MVVSDHINYCCAGVHDHTLTPSVIIERYTSLMDYLARKVWEMTQELHQGCESIAFKSVPVNAPNINFIETFKENMKGGFYDFVLMPPAGVACMTAIGATHLLTRARSRYACVTWQGLAKLLQEK